MLNRNIDECVILTGHSKDLNAMANYNDMQIENINTIYHVVKNQYIVLYKILQDEYRKYKKEQEILNEKRNNRQRDILNFKHQIVDSHAFVKKREENDERRSSIFVEYNQKWFIHYKQKNVKHLCRKYMIIFQDPILVRNIDRLIDYDSLLDERIEKAEKDIKLFEEYIYPTTSDEILRKILLQNETTFSLQDMTKAAEEEIKELHEEVRNLQDNVF